MIKKSNILFSEWYNNQPAKLQKYIKTQLLKELAWSEDKFHNKLTRTPITIPEQRIINSIFNEKIFDVTQLPVTSEN